MTEDQTAYGRGFEAGQDAAHTSLTAWRDDAVDALDGMRQKHVAAGAAGALLGVALLLSVLNATRR